MNDQDHNSEIEQLRAWVAADKAEIEALRSQLAHWKTFAIHAEGEHAAWKKAAIELGADKDWVLAPRAPTNEMVEAICAAVAQGDWPKAYPEQAQQRRRRDARLAWLEAVAAAPKKDDQRDTQNVGVLLDAHRRLEGEPVSDEPQSAVAAAYGGLTQTAQG